MVAEILKGRRIINTSFLKCDVGPRQVRIRPDTTRSRAPHQTLTPKGLTRVGGTGLALPPSDTALSTLVVYQTRLVAERRLPTLEPPWFAPSDTLVGAHFGTLPRDCSEGLSVVQCVPQCRTRPFKSEGTLRLLPKDLKRYVESNVTQYRHCPGIGFRALERIVQSL